MSHPNYGPVGGFSPLGGEDHTIYRSPASYQQPFPSYDSDHYHGDLGGGIELEQQRPFDPAHKSPGVYSSEVPYDPAPHPDSKARMYSTSSTVFPSEHLCMICVSSQY